MNNYLEITANHRRTYHHLVETGKISTEDVSRMIASCEYKDAYIQQLKTEMMQLRAGLQAGWREVNLNTSIKFKMTPEGLKILEGRHVELMSSWELKRQFTPPKVDDEGYTHMQLHVFAHEFCPSLGNLEDDFMEGLSPLIKLD